jgi:hypothetical protein
MNLHDYFLFVVLVKKSSSILILRPKQICYLLFYKKKYLCIYKKYKIMFSKLAYSIFERSIKDYHEFDNVDQPINNHFLKTNLNIYYM